MTDQQLLEASLARLERTGEIEYSGEFGAEIATFIPFACWLKANGKLAGRRVVTYGGMRPFYYFLDDAEYAEKPGARRWLPPEQRDWPSNSTYTATRQSWHQMPDYRARYGSEGPSFERPVLFIQNKFCVELNGGPINYLPLDALNGLLQIASDRFDIVYSRPRRMDGQAQFTGDENWDCDYPDLAVCRRFPRVTVLEDHCAATGAPYNLTKLRILARSRLFVAVQGGGAHLLACFGNSLMLLLHRVGWEHPHAYAAGAYKYLSNPAPILLVAHDKAQFVRGAALFGTVRIEPEGFRCDEALSPVLSELRI